MSSWWTTPENEKLTQGELILDCAAPVFEPEVFGENTEGKIFKMRIFKSNLIIITQSCDLENEKVPDVLLCSFYTLESISQKQAHYKDLNFRERIRRGEIPSHCLLPSPDDPDNLEQSLIVDFKSVTSLPRSFLLVHLKNSAASRKCLSSPYTEHLSQSFAKFFMRVALPKPIQRFK